MFSFGDDESKLGEYAWFGENAFAAGEPYAHRVGQRKPNPWDLQDMHGNVWEWSRDYYSKKIRPDRPREHVDFTIFGHSDYVVRQLDRPSTDANITSLGPVEAILWNPFDKRAAAPVA